MTQPYSSADGWYTLYEPRSGMPISVPKDSLELCLSQGFTRQAPGTEVMPEISPKIASGFENAESLIAINSASLSEIRGLNLSTAQAKATKERRPYKNLEDLVVKVPEVTFWGELESTLDFSVPEETGE